MARRIVAICRERGGDAPVRRVTVEVGMLTCLTPESLRFCYEALAGGTPLAGSTLEIVRVAGRSRCRRCGAGVEMTGLLATCACGSTDLEPPRGGDALRIRSLELAAAGADTEPEETS